MRKVRFAALLVAAALLLCFAGCAGKSDPNRLVVYQEYTDDETGILRATITMTWEDGKMVSMSHADTYESADAAEKMLENLTETIGQDDPGYHLRVEGNQLLYEQGDFSFWESYSKEKMIDMFEADGVWTVEK